MTEQRFCPFCGTGVVAGAAFCVACGKSLPGAVVLPPPGPPNAAAQLAPPPPALGVAYAAPPAGFAAPPAAFPAPMAPPPPTAESGSAPPTEAWAPLSAGYGAPPAVATPPPAVLPPPATYAAPPPSGASPGAAGPGMVWAQPPGGFGGGPGAPGAPAGRPAQIFGGGVGGARPLGITIIAILAGIGAVLGLWVGLQYVQAADYFYYGSETVRMIGIVILVVSLAWIVVIWGLWMLKPWAWIAAGAVAAVSLGLQVLALINGTTDVGGTLIQIGANAVILYYLSTPAVRAVFRRTPGG